MSTRKCGGELMHPFKFRIDVFNRLTTPDSMPSINASISLLGAINPEIHPLPATDRGIGLKAGAYLFITSEIDTFQTLDYGITKEFVNSDFIKANTFYQC